MACCLTESLYGDRTSAPFIHLYEMIYGYSFIHIYTHTLPSPCTRACPAPCLVAMPYAPRLHACMQIMAQYATEPVRVVTALPQAMLDLPECNFLNWTNANGGIFKPQGTNLSGKHFILIGGGQGNLFLSILLKQADAQVTVLEANEALAGRAECHRLSDGTMAAMGMMCYGRGQGVWIAILDALAMRWALYSRQVSLTLGWFLHS